MRWIFLPLVLCSATELPDVDSITKSLASTGFFKRTSKINLQDSHVGGEEGRYPEYSPNTRRKKEAAIKSKSATHSAANSALSTPRGLFSNPFKPKKGKEEKQKKRMTKDDEDERSQEDFTDETYDEALHGPMQEDNTTPPNVSAAPSSNSSSSSAVNNGGFPMSESSPSMTKRKMSYPPTVPANSLRDSTLRTRLSSNPTRLKNNSDSSGSGSAPGTPPMPAKRKNSRHSTRKLLQSTFSRPSPSSSGNPSTSPKESSILSMAFPKGRGSPNSTPPLTPEGGSPTASPSSLHRKYFEDDYEFDDHLEREDDLEGMVDRKDEFLFQPLDTGKSEDGVVMVDRLFRQLDDLARPSIDLTFMAMVSLPLFASHAQIIEVFKSHMGDGVLDYLWSIYVSLYYQGLSCPQTHHTHYALSIPAEKLLNHLRPPRPQTGKPEWLLRQVDAKESLLDDRFFVKMSVEKWCTSLMEYYGWLRAELNPTDLVHSLLTPASTYQPFALLQDFSHQLTWLVTFSILSRKQYLSWWLDVCNYLKDTCQLEPLIAILEGLWAIFDEDELKDKPILTEHLNIYEDREHWSGYRPLYWQCLQKDPHGTFPSFTVILNIRERLREHNNRDLRFLMAVGGHSLHLTSPQHFEPVVTDNVRQWAAFQRTYSSISNQVKHEYAKKLKNNK